MADEPVGCGQVREWIGVQWICTRHDPVTGCNGTPVGGPVPVSAAKLLELGYDVSHTCEVM